MKTELFGTLIIVKTTHRLREKDYSYNSVEVGRKLTILSWHHFLFMVEK